MCAQHQADLLYVRAIFDRVSDLAEDYRNRNKIDASAELNQIKSEIKKERAA